MWPRVLPFLWVELFWWVFVGGAPLSSSSSDVDVSVSDSDVIDSSAESASAKTPSITSSATKDLRFNVFVTEAILKKKVCTCYLLRHNLENDLKMYFRDQALYILEAKALKKTIQKRRIYTLLAPSSIY